jgi:hypothetical protein
MSSSSQGGGSQLGNLWNKPAAAEGLQEPSGANSLRKQRSPGMQNTAFSRPPQQQQRAYDEPQPIPSQRPGYEKASVSKFRQDRSKMGRPGQRSDSPANSMAGSARLNSYGSSNGGGEEYGGQGSYGRSEKPVMSATVQFGAQDEYSGYSGGYDQGAGSGGRNAGRRMGLPSGPRGNRN